MHVQTMTAIRLCCRHDTMEGWLVAVVAQGLVNTSARQNGAWQEERRFALDQTLS